MLKLLITSNNTGWTALVLRLGLGAVMFPHGAQLLLGWFGGPGFAGTMDTFTQMLHIPAPWAFLAIITEFFGSLALLAGAFTRLAAAGMAILMAVAVATVHLQYGFFMNWYGSQKGEGFEYHVLAGTIALALVIAGGGKWSVDSSIARKLASRAAK